MYIASEVSSVESIFSLIGVCIIFLLVLAGAYFTSRWVGKTNFLQPGSRNIQVIETFRLNQNKYIQILKIGKKYVAVAVSKDHVEFLTELQEDELSLLMDESAKNNTVNFKDILTKLTKKK